jgi:hypothetical protein
LWSLGSVIIGTAASVIGVNWSFGVCGAVCAIAASALLFVTRRGPASNVPSPQP